MRSTSPRNQKLNPQKPQTPSKSKTKSTRSLSMHSKTKSHSKND